MKRRITAALLGASLAVATLAGSVATASTAKAAAPASCSVLNDVYKAPASVTGSNGALITCSATMVPNVPGSIDLSAWRVQYVSTDETGKKVAVSGLVMVPKAAWAGTGTRPIIAFNPGTIGLGSQCAFSKQLAGSYQDEYEGTNIQKALQAGYAVAATDGIGYLDGQTHPYVIGQDAGHALLDIARTAIQIPGGGLTKGTDVGIWGYSEGGQASLWGAQLAHSYAPDVNVVGAAAGGVPGDLKLVASQLNGSPFAGFLVDAVVGISSQYPGVPLNSLLNDKGKTAVTVAKTNCLFGTLLNFVGAKIEDYSTQGLSLDQIYAVKDATSGKTVGTLLDAEKLGVNIGKIGSGAKYEMGFPTLQYRGALEEIINTKTENATRDAYCKAGLSVNWDQGYPGEHLTTDGLAVDNVVKWFGDRFAGKTESGNCWLPSL